MSKKNQSKKAAKPPKVKQPPVKESYDWKILIENNSQFTAAPVNLFKTLSVSENWTQIVTKGLKVEVHNKDAITFEDDAKFKIEDSFWIASVIEIRGFFVLLRYEGYEDDDSEDFWKHIYDDDLRAVGWSFKNHKHLLPTQHLFNKQVDNPIDWKPYLVSKLNNSHTLPENFRDQIESSSRCIFDIGLKLEAINVEKVCAVRVATIVNIIGPRIQIAYDINKPLDSKNSFWCHQLSSLIHPVGWALLVGHELDATDDYIQSTLEKLNKGKWADDDADFRYFPHIYYQMKNTKGKGEITNPFQEGMKIEAIDALNMNQIRLSTVFKVLRYDYLLIGVDGEMEEDGTDCWCCHKSECLPIGFCKKHKVAFHSPANYKKKEFDYKTYLKETNSIAAPDYLFVNDIHSQTHGFRKGMHIEATDLMDPNLICPAVIKQVAGKLLKISFIGWDEQFDQWVDCNSPEIYPIGWCKTADYLLETPPKTDNDDNDSFVSFESIVKPTKSTKSTKPKSRGRPKKYTAPIKKQKTGKKQSLSRIAKNYASSSETESGIESFSDSSDSVKIKKKNTNKRVSTQKARKTKTSTSDSDLVDHFRYRRRTTRAQKKENPFSCYDDIETIDFKSNLVQQDAVSSSQAENLEEENLKVTSEENVQETLEENVENDVQKIPIVPVAFESPDQNSQAPLDKSSCLETGIPSSISNYEVDVIFWTPTQVKEFLDKNGCSDLSDDFLRNEINGDKFVTLSNEEIFKITNKLGLSMKVSKLIAGLKDGAVN